ncbi:hypothetical protein GCM10011506_18220 [Marivirga lumbricoides]|uniref:Outer membrane protein beta-barrel domain-containing protein n=1 Tax=Marivirga lumbricoides TaxID=1046115 RepID=A0ABQ1M2A7_9BACT|nr:hypothetical protein GCM10011506_18220 [Marivirga lumbricoides]
MGFKGGVTISTVNGQGSGSFIPGFQAGFYKQFGFEEQPYFQLELLVSQKGSHNWSTENLRNLNLFYLDVPIMFGIYIGQKVNLNLGFQPSLFLGGNFRSEESAKNLWGEVASMDYSTLFGIEYNLRESFIIGGRYNHSFVPLQSYTNDFATNKDLPLLMVAQIYCRIKIDNLSDLNPFSNRKKKD